jgi:hypothetical protein
MFYSTIRIFSTSTTPLGPAIVKPDNDSPHYPFEGATVMTFASKAATEAESHDLSAIRRDIANLRDDLAGLTRGLGKNFSDSVTRNSGRAAKAIGQQIDEQPLWTLVLVCAIGFVGSRLLLR